MFLYSMAGASNGSSFLEAKKRICELQLHPERRSFIKLAENSFSEFFFNEFVPYASYLTT